MELPGFEYLFNLSLLAITFTAVSALVMLVRQTMGGKLSNFDVYLITAYVSLGFVLAAGAILPPLIALFEPPPALLWAIASGLAAILLGAVMVNIVARRRKASPEPMSRGVIISYSVHGLDVLLLIANAVVPALQDARLFAAALTLSLVSLMWAFVRRIESLLAGC